MPQPKQKLRQSARMQECTFQIPSVCNFDPETVVLCHLPDDSGTGKMGGKSEDWIAAFGCSNCHDFIDGRRYLFLSHGELKDDIEFYMRRATLRTWKKWIETGLIKV